MSLEPINQSLFSDKFKQEDLRLKRIKQIVLDYTKVEAGIKLTTTGKLILTVSNSSAASEINLVNHELLQRVNNYLTGVDQPKVETLIIKQI